MKGNEAIVITQNWLRLNYENHPLFTTEISGINNTIKGLIQALQIELGVIANGIWEDDTTEAFELLFPNGLSEKTEINENKKIVNIIYILQGAFYIAREISPGRMDGHFGKKLTTVIKKFQMQAGVISDGIVTPYLLKAILTLESYELDKEGDEEIRIIQQNLNYKYGKDIGLIPTNGIYNKTTNEALKKVIQLELDRTLEDLEKRKNEI